MDLAPEQIAKDVCSIISGLEPPEHKNGHPRRRGLGWVLIALFVVADMAGSGIVALPTAIVRCQFYPGLVLLTLVAAIATLTAVLLGKCWEMLLRRYSVYRNSHCRKPYAEIGFRALGPKMRTTVSVCVNVTLFGASTVFLLLCAKNIRDFVLLFLHIDLSFCSLLPLIAALLLPITLLKSPNDFWPFVVGGMISTGVAILLICTGTLLDAPRCVPHREFPGPKLANYLYAIGTILFAHGGHTAFPTIQHDMERPQEFRKSAILGFTMMTLFNLATASFGGFIYGDSLRDSVINSIQTVWIQQAISLMITAHCLLTITLIVNPLDQEVEELLGVPHEFGWKRVAVRSGVLASVVFVAASVPSFGPVLDLIGGSMVSLTSIIFPSLFYLFLSAGEKRQKQSKSEEDEFGDQEEEAGGGEAELITFKEMIQRTDRKTLALCGTIIVLSTAVGAIATVSALRALTGTHFVPPCFLQSLLSTDEMHRPAKLISGPNTTTITTLIAPLTPTYCCGHAQNISRFGTDGHCAEESHVLFY